MINVTNIFKEELVKLCHSGFKDREDAFNQVSKYFLENDIIDNVDDFVESLYEREMLGSTYMGNGIALPHGKSKAVKKTSMIMIQCSEPFEYETYDGKHEVDMIFMLAISDESTADEYLRLLSSLARMLAYEDFVDILKKVESYDEIISAANDTLKNLSNN